MDAEPTIPQLVTAILGIVAVFITVLQLKEHPKTRVLLFLILLAVITGLGWYVSPSVKSNNFIFYPARAAEQGKQLDSKVTDEAQEIVESQHKIDLARKQAEVFQAQKLAAEAQRERDLAAEEEVQEKKHLDALEGATQARTLLDTKLAVQGSWQCGPLGVTWVFNPDGTVTIPIYPNGHYEVLDPTHINVVQWGMSYPYTLDLTGSEASLKRFLWSCKKPKRN